MRCKTRVRCSVAKTHSAMLPRLLINNQRPDLSTHSLVSTSENIKLFLILQGIYWKRLEGRSQSRGSQTCTCDADGVMQDAGDRDPVVLTETDQSFGSPVLRSITML